jgi:4-nitrophenyl phosphatase
VKNAKNPSLRSFFYKEEDVINHSKLDLSTIKALIIDMDGVVWRGTEPIGDLPAIFARIHSLGLKAIMATNNATLTPQLYVEKMSSFGVELEPWQVINSSQAAAALLRKRFPKGGQVYLVGEAGLLEAMAEAGFEQDEDGGEVLAVIAALDRSFNYAKLRRAANLIRSGALFIGTNHDPSLVVPEGLDPGAGSIIAAIETTTGQKAVLAGKPNPGMYQAAFERLQVSPRETLAVGDRLDTDIAGAQAAGCPSCMVLTGVNTIEDARAWNPPPELIAESLEALVSSLS